MDDLGLSSIPTEPNDGYCSKCRLAWLRLAGVTQKEWAAFASMVTGMPEEAFNKCSVPQHKFIEQFEKSKTTYETRKETNMLIQGGSDKEFELCPEGVHVGVCADEVDLGWSETEYEGVKRWRHQMALLFQVDEVSSTGERFIVPKIFSVSIHPNSTLRKFLDQWRGKPFTDEEAKAFETSKLIGVNGMIQIVHKVRANGRTRADILSATPLPKKTANIQVENFARPEWISKFIGKPERPANGGGTEDSVPF